MKLSIVITTYNRAEGLLGLLDAFELQDDRDFQVVVAIDGSTDGTEEMVRNHKSSFDLKWVNTHCQEYGLAVARNRGILAADGEAVVILDDDSYPAHGFVAAHRASVRAGVITGGPRDPSDPMASPHMAWKMAELRRLSPLSPMTIGRMRHEHPTAYLIENNICLLRDDWIAMGLFSERLKLYGFIGQEFFARAEHLGLRYQFNPDAAVVHRGEMEGDNGFQRSRKTRQIKIATLIRPSLMKPEHYRAQVAWAQASAEGRSLPEMPAYKLGAALAAPYRLLGLAVLSMKRRMKALLRPLLK
jgi:glycosyltransferase involved in cell wall biosynthesis